MLGPSGSGKTTCLMMLAGFETPTHGEILLDGNIISNIPPHKRGIGMVFQNYALFPHMTVYENLAFPLRVRKISKDDIETKVEKALSMVSLSGFGNRMPGQLSGGQQQRVAAARAMATKPEVIFADEPSGNLDSKSSKELLVFMKSVVDELNQTIIMVTHDPYAASFASRVVMLKDGKIASDLEKPSQEEIVAEVTALTNV